MQQTRTHKAVTRRIEAKKLLSRWSQSEYGEGTSLVPIVTSLILGYMKANTELFTQTGQTVFTIFIFSEKC